MSGIAIDLWREIAKELQLTAEFEALPLKELLDKTASGELDIAIAPLTVTGKRELRFDFSHPYFEAGLSAAMPQKRAAGFGRFVLQVIGSRFLHITMLVSLTLVAGGALIWLLERRDNSEHYGGKWYSGLGAGLWWAVVTISTVGYGDKVPRTAAGRAAGVVLIFAGVIVFSTFTAVITSALTMNTLDARTPQSVDLTSLRVGAVSSSVSEEYLRARGVRPQLYTDLNDALVELSKERIDVVLGDRPLLLYRIAESYPGILQVLSDKLKSESYAFAFPTGSPMREDVNHILIDTIGSEAWQRNLRRYLGEN